MKIVNVERVPRRKTYKHNLMDFFEEFMDSDMISAKVEFTSADYCSAKSCYSNLLRSAKHHGYPIKVILRSDDVYLEKL